MLKKLLVTLLLSLGLATTATAEVKRTVISNGLYGDALPSGAYAVGVGRTVETHQGPIPIPDAESSFLMFPRITEVGGFKIAAKSHSSDRTWVYSDGTWIADGRISHGVQGHIWRPDGTLFVLEPCDNCESQGIRYWDNGPVWGSPTYNPISDFAKQLGVTKLYEWTKCGDVIAGQGDEGGLVAQYDGKHYLLEPGEIRFVQAHCTGDRYSFAATRLVGKEVVLLWMDKSDIARFPLYQETQPTPEPTPEPNPEPQPVYVPIQEQFDVVLAIWNRATPEQRNKHAFVAEAVAFELRKLGRGAFCVNQKRGTQGDSEDAISIAHPQGAGGFAVIDIIGGMGGPNPTPVWIDQTQATIDGGTVGGCRVPTDVFGGTKPTPDPQPTPDCKACEDREKTLQAQVAALTLQLEESASIRASLERQVSELIQAHVDATNAHDEAVRQRDLLQQRLDSATCIKTGFCSFLGGCQIIFKE